MMLRKLLVGGIVLILALMPFLASADGPRPTYQGGYARGPEESARPGGWNGLRGFWITDLGPTGTRLNDISPRRNNGTLTAMAASKWIIDGKFGYVLDYNGSTEWVSVSSAVISAIPVTYMVWIKVDGTGGGTNIVSTADASEDDRYYAITTDGGVTAFRWQVRSDTNSFNSTNFPVAQGGTVTLGAWHHVVGVSESAAIHKLYVNGVLVDTDTNTTTNPAGLSITGINRLVRATQDSGVDGDISQVRIYNRALTAAEIEGIYRDPLGIVRIKQKGVGAVAEEVEAVASESQIIIIGWKAPPWLVRLMFWV